VSHHEAIVNGIQSRDEAGAAQAMRTHLERMGELIMDNRSDHGRLARANSGQVDDGRGLDAERPPAAEP
jgi:hypothetical protein